MRKLIHVLATVVFLTLFALTARATVNAPLYYENFEAAGGAQVPPPGWQVELISGGNQVSFVTDGTRPTSTPDEGTVFVEFQSYTASAGSSNRLQQTKPISTIGCASVSVGFAWFVDGEYPSRRDRMEVQYSTDGLNWTTAGTFERYAAGASQWTYPSVTLPAAANNQPKLYIAFLFISEYGNNCHLDAIVVSADARLQRQITEGFENAGIGQVPPPGWGIDLVSGAGSIAFQATGSHPYTNAYEGTMFVEFDSFNALAGTKNRLKRTTPISTWGCRGVVVDFEWLTGNDFVENDRVELQYSTDGSTWHTVATYSRYATTTQWQKKSAVLPVAANEQLTLYVGFLFTSEWGSNCHMDLVHIKRLQGNIAPMLPLLLSQ